MTLPWPFPPSLSLLTPLLWAFSMYPSNMKFLPSLDTSHRTARGTFSPICTGKCRRQSQVKVFSYMYFMRKIWKSWSRKKGGIKKISLDALLHLMHTINSSRFPTPVSWKTNVWGQDWWVMGTQKMEADFAGAGFLLWVSKQPSASLTSTRMEPGSAGLEVDTEVIWKHQRKESPGGQQGCVAIPCQAPGTQLHLPMTQPGPLLMDLRASGSATFMLSPVWGTVSRNSWEIASVSFKKAPLISASAAPRSVCIFQQDISQWELHSDYFIAYTLEDH